MTRLLNFFNQRSKREQNLLVIAVVLITCLLAVSLVSNLVARNSLAAKRYQNAKSDYEYVKAGAMNLLQSAKISEIKNNRATLEPAIQDIAKSDGLKLEEIAATEGSLRIAFIPGNLRKAEQLLEEVSRLSEFAIDTIELQTESGQQLVTATYLEAMIQSPKEE
jgi:type II secretory pathway component PulM